MTMTKQTSRRKSPKAAKTAPKTPARPAPAPEPAAAPAKKLDAKRLFVSAGALLEGHFQLSSGLHSDRYMQAAMVLADPGAAEPLGAALAGLLEPGERPDVVVSPAVGGIVIGHEVARALGCRAYFAERVHDAMTLRRGFRLAPGEKVAVVEDVITTGGSVRDILTLARSWGAKPVAVLVIALRSAEEPQFGVPLKALLRLPLRTHRPEACPLCKEGLPLVKPGSREFRKLALSARKETE